MNRTVNFPNRHRLLLLLIGVVFLLGCGGGKGPKNYVVGKVTFKGKPVLGTITFLTSDGKEVTAPINPDGSYMVGEPPMGDNKIAIRGLPGASSAPPAEMPKGFTKDMPGQVNLAAAAGVPPPMKYADPSNGLTIKVTGGKQTHDIELKP